MKLLLFLLCPLFLTAQTSEEKPKGKDWTRCTLISVKRTMKGVKHIFVSDNSDTLTRFFPSPLKVDSCYYVKPLETAK